MRLAKQLLWQQSAYPVEFARAKAYLTTAQFFALRLGGRAASEISQLAAQGHIWDLVRHQPSSIMRERGWDHLLPPRVPAGAVLGTVSEAVARRTGLARSTEILCGVHDSNANLFRYKAAGMADASILSTGTWMIGFQRDLAPDKLDARRAMVLNIDVDGENVPSTLTMTGREYDLIRQRTVAADAAVLAALPTLIARGTLALPSFVGDDGLFPGAGSSRADHRTAARNGLPNGRGWRSSTPHSAQTAASMRLAARNASSSTVASPPTCPSRAALPTLRPSQSVSVSQSRDGTALGAALLWRRFSRTAPVSSVVLEAVTPLGEDGFESAHAFRRLSVLDRLFGATIMTDRNHADRPPGHRRYLPRDEPKRPQPGDFRQSFAPDSERHADHADELALRSHDVRRTSSRWILPRTTRATIALHPNGAFIATSCGRETT